MVVPVMGSVAVVSFEGVSVAGKTETACAEV
jgi:hypothetical protein